MSTMTKILYVDDNPHDRALVRDALEKESVGFEVLEATSRDEFERLLGDHQFDVVLSDFNILGFDGLQVLESVQVKYPSLPVIIVTGTGSEEIAVEAMKKGAADYIIKAPKHIRRLPLSIHTILEFRRSREEKLRAELALKESEARFRLLFNTSMDGVLLTSPDGSIFSANPAACEMFGRPEEELCRLGRACVVDSTDPRLTAGLLERAQKGNFVGTLTFVRKNRSKFEAELSSVLFKDHEGRDRSSMIIRDITERKQAEEAVRESDQRFKILTETSPVGIFRTDPTGWTTYVNPHWTEISGLTLSEALGDGWLDHVHPDDRAGVIAGWDANVRERKISNREYRFLRKDGKVVWVYGQAVPAINPEGAVTGYIGTITDITERKRVEEELRERERRLSTIYDTVADVIYLVAIEGKGIYRFISTNKAFGHITGLDQREVVGKLVNEVIPEPSLSLVLGKYKQAIEENRTVRWEETTQYPAGTLTGEVSVTPVVDEKGCSTHLVGSVHDVTERIRAEENIRTLSRAIEQSPASIIVTDPKGVIEYVNPKFTSLTGYTVSEVVGNKPSILKSGHTTEEEYRHMWEMLTAGKSWRGEFQNRKKNGELYWESASISPVVDHTGAITHFVAVKEDITQKRIMEERILRSQRLESLGALAGGIAHDLNNVLSPVLMSIEVLKRKFPDEKTRTMLDAVDVSTRRGKEIIKQILTFARGMSGEPMVIQPAEIVSEMEVMIRETFPRNLSVKTEIGREVSAVKMDATQLHQVLMNLCVNSRDAMTSGGSLTIRLHMVQVPEEMVRRIPGAKPGPYVRFSVADTGMGMTPEVLQRMFDPFFTTKETGKGTGLGLSTVHSIVDSCGGFIDVHSTPMMGTTISVFIPAFEGIAGHVEEMIQPEQGNGETILVVDDEEAIRMLTKIVLESNGYTVYSASDGTEAVTLFEEKKEEIDLVITDIMMPFMNGPSMIRSLRFMKPHLKIIAASGLISLESTTSLVEGDVDSILMKPISEATLLREVRKVLTSK